MKLADALRKLAETPEDLSPLADLIPQIEALEQTELDLMDKVDKLHEANKRYLKMVTVAEPVKDPEPEPEKIPTLKEVAASLIERNDK